MLDPAGAMGRRAWEWIVRHQDEFFAVDASPTGEQTRAKYAAELALVSGTLVDEVPEARALLVRAWQELGGGQRLARLLPTWPIAATSYLPFRLAGYRSLELDKNLAEGSWLCGHDRWPPFARFAIGITLESIGIAWPWDEGAVVLANRFFDRPTRETPPIRAELLAHAIMWRSHMGRHPAGLGLEATELYRGVSGDWHVLLADAGLIDPLGEIVIADICAGGRPPAASLALLCGEQRDDGAMPRFRNDIATTFDDLYHSTCVVALAGTLAARLPYQV